MRKIAFVHNRFPAGGAERVTMDIARYLDSIGGYRVYVFASHPGSFPQEYLTLVKIPSQAIQSRRSHYVEKLINISFFILYLPYVILYFTFGCGS